MMYHLVEEQDEVDSEGYKQSKEPQVVEIPGQVMLERKGQAEVAEFGMGKRTPFSHTDLFWLEVCAALVLLFGGQSSRTALTSSGLIWGRNQK